MLLYHLWIYGPESFLSITTPNPSFLSKPCVGLRNWPRAHIKAAQAQGLYYTDVFFQKYFPLLMHIALPKRSSKIDIFKIKHKWYVAQVIKNIYPCTRGPNSSEQMLETCA